MNRRETIKSLLLGSIAAGLTLKGCAPEVEVQPINFVKDNLYGRTPKEKLRDKKLLETIFFNDHELSTIAVLCDIILPKSEGNDSAMDAEVKEFIEFIVKDIEEFQVPIKGGLMWLDNFSNKLFNKEFKICSEEEQFYICDQIAYPNKTVPELKQGEKFFTIMRNLTLTGYFTSKIGINDLGYKGNTPNIWDGVPQEVLDQQGLKYDEEWLAKCVDQSKRDILAEWDDEGNLIS